MQEFNEAPQGQEEFSEESLPEESLPVETHETTAQPEDTPVEEAEAPEASMQELLEQENLFDLPRPGQVRQGTIASIGDNEVLVSIGAKSEGVIPIRELEQLDEEERQAFEVGTEINVFVVTPEDGQGNLLLSYLRAQEEADWEKAQATMDAKEVYEGEISGYNKGGLIVKLGRLRGFVPASQVSLSRRVAYGGGTPEQRWGKRVGEPLVARIIEVDRERHRLIFSERAALQESRESLKERLLDELEVGQSRTGRVTSLAEFGAFVNISGADGLVHLSEISWERVVHPKELLKVGQEVKVKVISVDRERKRIGLSIRQLQDDPWEEKVAMFREGQLVMATITRLTKFGAFARIDETDLEGLIHVSELSDRRVEHPKEVISEGDVITLRIIKVDVPRRRIGLSIRKVHSAAYTDIDWETTLAETMRELDGDVEAEELPTVEGDEAEAVESAATEEQPAEETEAETAEETPAEEGAPEEEPAEAVEEEVAESADVEPADEEPAEEIEPETAEDDPSVEETPEEEPEEVVEEEAAEPAGEEPVDEDTPPEEPDEVEEEA